VASQNINTQPLLTAFHVLINLILNRIKIKIQFFGKMIGSAGNTYSTTAHGSKCIALQLICLI
jgi:hypothetical protein